MQAGVGLLVLIGTAPFSELARNFIVTFSKIEHELARNFIVTFSKIEQFINEQSRPFIARVYRPTEKVRMLNPHHLGQIELWVSN